MRGSREHRNFRVILLGGGGGQKDFCPLLRTSHPDAAESPHGGNVSSRRELTYRQETYLPKGDLLPEGRLTSRRETYFPKGDLLPEKRLTSPKGDLLPEKRLTSPTGVNLLS